MKEEYHARFIASCIIYQREGLTYFSNRITTLLQNVGVIH
jgi:hypothetical protein